MESIRRQRWKIGTRNFFCIRNNGEEIQEAKNRLRGQIEEACEIAEGNLPPAKKLLFLMAFRDGYHFKDIGTLLKISGESVSRRLDRIEQEIKDIAEKEKNENV